MIDFVLWLWLGSALLLAVLGLRGERGRARFYRRRPAPVPDTPPASVIVPVKGLDEGLRENLASLAALDYPDFELIVVARSQSDLPLGVTPSRARVVFAGPCDSGTGEKVHNLLAAVKAARPESAVLAFADSDGRVSAGWLRALVAGLDSGGAATGYRWHLPDPVDFWSALRSVWNAVIAGGMGPGANAFCWGGAMAIRRETFDKLDIPAWWRDAISDDYRLSEAVRTAGLPIVFAPGALTACVDHTTPSEFFPWIVRQMKITRFYAPALWKLALFAHILYCGSIVAAVALNTNLAYSALAAQLAIGMGKGWLRVANARLAMPEYRSWFRRNVWWHVFLVPVGTWLWLYACLRAAGSNEIEWRGYRIALRRLARPD